MYAWTWAGTPAARPRARTTVASRDLTTEKERQQESTTLHTHRGRERQPAFCVGGTSTLHTRRGYVNKNGLHAPS
eukprot:364899-Chlamydomonas_euryale.AAC.39